MTPRLLLLLPLLAALLAPLAAAAACASVCYTTELTGFSAGGVTGCSCSGSGASRSGSGGCQCGSCYLQQSGTVIGYAVSSDGTCAYGVNCGDCDYESSSASASVSASGSTGSSTSADGSVASSTSASAGSAGSNEAGGSAGSAGSSSAASASSSSSSSSGLKTWQIALIICSVVLVFGVACVSILTCYCKAKRRLEENEDEFDQQAAYLPHGPASGSGYADAGGYPRRPTNPSPYSQYSGGVKSPPVAEVIVGNYSSSLEAGTSRIGMGMLPNGGSNGDLVAMRPNGGSNGDLAGMYNAGRRPSQGSYNLASRPSTELYSTRDRDALAVEL